MSSVPFTGRDTSLSLPTRNSQVLSMPFFRVMGFDPDVTACGSQIGVIQTLMAANIPGCELAFACKLWHSSECDTARWSGGVHAGYHWVEGC